MKLLFFTLFAILPLNTFAQINDSIFCGNIYSEEFYTNIEMNLYENNVVIPGQEIFGELPGYINFKYDSRIWILTSAKLLNNNTAELVIINDYGSEDLKATLTYNPIEDKFFLRQDQGATIKFAKDRKWFKLPKTIEFKKRKSSTPKT